MRYSYVCVVVLVHLFRVTSLRVVSVHCFLGVSSRLLLVVSIVVALFCIVVSMCWYWVFHVKVYVVGCSSCCLVTYRYVLKRIFFHIMEL